MTSWCNPWKVRLSAQVLEEIASEHSEKLTPRDMDLEAFEILAGEELYRLNEDCSVHLLRVCEGYALSGSEDFDYAQLLDRIMLFRELLLTASTDEAHSCNEVRVALSREVARSYGIDDQQFHGFGWA